MIDFDKIISRLKSIKGLKYNKDVGAELGLSSADFSLRKKRGTLLPIIIEWAINQNVNLDYLIAGKGDADTFNKPDTVFSLGPVVKAHMDAVKKFRDPDTAYLMTLDLLEIEKVSAEAFEALRTYIKGVKAGVTAGRAKNDSDLSKNEPC